MSGDREGGEGDGSAGESAHAQTVRKPSTAIFLFFKIMLPVIVGGRGERF